MDGTCLVRKGYFFNLEIPEKDDYIGEVTIGGGNEMMKESIYQGRCELHIIYNKFSEILYSLFLS